MYVFQRTGANWAQQAYIKASNTGVGDGFGALGCAVHGNMLVVSALEEDSSAALDPFDNTATNAGAIYIFQRSGTTWTQSSFMKGLNTEAYDRIGSVAVDGNTIVFGASGEASGSAGVGADPNDNSAPAAGAVYVVR